MVVHHQQKRGLIDWMVKWPDRVRSGREIDADEMEDSPLSQWREYGIFVFESLTIASFFFRCWNTKRSNSRVESFKEHPTPLGTSNKVTRQCLYLVLHLLGMECFKLV